MKKKRASELIAREREKGRSEGFRAGEARERERTKAVIGVAKPHLLIGQKPEHREVIVALGPTDSPHFFHPGREIERYHRAPVARFEAVREAWASGEGHTVVWFSWRYIG